MHYLFKVRRSWLPTPKALLVTCTICCSFTFCLAAVAEDSSGLRELPNLSDSADRGTSTESVNDTPITPNVSSPAVDSQYLLGTGDRVQVTVFNAPDYSGDFVVLAGGLLNLPLAGEVSVGDLTLQQASEKISAQLTQYIRRPTATVSLLAARPLQVAIAGQIYRPGAYTLPADDENGVPTLTQVISLAGGITQSADVRNISIQRQTSQAIGATEQTLEVNLWQLLESGELDADLPLQRGDSIIVPTATALSVEETAELASASFSPDTITVNVVGEVENPGAIELPPNTPLNQAILTAGGFNRRARESSVDLIRLNSNGTVDRRQVDIDFAAGVNAQDNPPLRPNDTVVVETNGLSRTTDTVNSVLSPITGSFNFLRLLGF